MIRRRKQSQQTTNRNSENAPIKAASRTGHSVLSISAHVLIDAAGPKTFFFFALLRRSEAPRSCIIHTATSTLSLPFRMRGVEREVMHSLTLLGQRKRRCDKTFFINAHVRHASCGSPLPRLSLTDQLPALARNLYTHGVTAKTQAE